MLFDAANAALLKRHPPLPATRGGQAVACSGQVSRIRWQLADDEEADQP
jgi:hypothetical protein